jgi:hypothetical protein
MENMTKRELNVSRETKTKDIILVGILLAAGAILRLFVPPFFGITPNFVIVMYCLVIMIIKPKAVEVLGISLVAALICQLTTKSAVPYINFLSEPAGAFVAFGIISIVFRNKFFTTFKPAVVTFLGTFASGLVYITTLKLIFLYNGSAGKAYTGLLLVVLFTAIANTIIAQLIYYPIMKAVGKKA